MIHQQTIQLLTQIKISNNILYIVVIFLFSYLLLGLSAGILFAAAVNLKAICILGPEIKFKEKFVNSMAVIFFWPFALPTIYELWYNFCMYLACLFAGTTFRGNVMSNKSIVQIRHIVCNHKGEVSFKKLATTNMACVEELITDGEYKGEIFVTIFGLEEKPKSQIVPTGVTFCNTTTLDFLKELKENGLVGLKRVEAEKEIQFDFEGNKSKSFNLVFPEEVFCYVFQDISTVYVTRAISTENEELEDLSDSSLMDFKDQLYHEAKVNKDNILFMVDYTNHEAYALDTDMNEIMNCEFEGNDCEDKFTRVRIGNTILKYIYNSKGYLDRIDIEKTDREDDFGYYLKIDEYEESNRKRERVTVTYMVPYLRDTGGVFVYSEGCRIYRTDNIYIERGKIIEQETQYRILSDKEELDLNDSFSKTMENSAYIL